MDPQRITELANLLRNNGDKILNSEFTLTLSGSLLRALNDSFTLIADSVDIGAINAQQQQQQIFQVVKPNNSKSHVFRDLQLVHDFVQKTTLLCIVHYPTEHYFEGIIDIGKFRALKRLEVQKTDVRQIVGIQALRAQLQQLICVKSLRGGVDDIITHCGGDKTNGFVWNELKMADFSYNCLQTVDTSLEFAQYLQHLNLRHNKLHSVEAIKWLPHLKTLDLSYNCLQHIPRFHLEACKRLQLLNMSNNFVEDLIDVAKLEALTDLDLSDNCLLDHRDLLPLSVLVTLNVLNLYGNALHYHPKHRLATAQYLHKNVATVKFILDYEPLSKSEKALIGTHQLRHVGALNRYATTSSSTSISSVRLTSTSSNTPASSVGSLQSFKFNDSSTDIKSNNTSALIDANVSKKRTVKPRTVEFDEDDTLHGNTVEVPAATSATKTTQETIAKPEDAMQKSLIFEDNNTEHLEAKKQIETLRNAYGAEWLQSGNAAMIESVLGLENANTTNCENSRQLFDDYLGELSATHISNIDSIGVAFDKNNTMPSSTPTNESILRQQFVSNLTPIKASANNETTMYKSLDDSHQLTNETIYASAANTTDTININTTQPTTSKYQQQTTNETLVDDKKLLQVTDDDDDKDDHAHLKNIYASSHPEEDDIEISDTEPDECCYIVHTGQPNSDSIFLTLSSNFLREKDAMTQRTKTKWGIKILESCERLTSDTLRINFDTVKKDKQERVYTVDENLCQELERKLRAILSERGLNEMNIIIYRCVNCGSQFMIEQKQKYYNVEPRCPDCRSTFVAEIHDLPESLDKPRQLAGSQEKLSPAAIVDESTNTVTAPLFVQPAQTTAPTALIDSVVEDNNSIVAPMARLTANNTTTKRRTLLPNTKSSANSLNESSSCSRISNSHSSYDSNQSVVGSSNTERELEFRTNCESDVDIISNPSQSSIEVLDQNCHTASRKSSVERHILNSPTMATIDDQNYAQSFIEREFGALAVRAKPKQITDEQLASLPATDEFKLKSGASVSSNTTLTNVLTESSSSGSVTDSICTTYDQTEKQKTTASTGKVALEPDKIVLHNLLVQAERDNEANNKTVTMSDDVNGFGAKKKEDPGLSAMFGAVVQSTNILMSSSKKLIDSEASNKNSLTLSGTSNQHNCQSYKFNYVDFNDIDHRLKLYFYQTKFEEAGERFKWLVRGRIYNEQNQTLSDGLIVMSNCKCYVMEVFAPPHEDVTKWLRPLVSVTSSRLTSIQLLPWKLGLAFTLRDWGGFLLLLQDILRTDSLLLFFANGNLPNQCIVDYQPAAQILKRLSAAVMDEKIKMCSLLNSCEIKCDNARRRFDTCTFLATDTRLYLSSGKFNWLSVYHEHDNAEVVAADAVIDDSECDIELCVTQFMSNLIEVERQASNVFAINFLDETQNKCELWLLTFETQENADSCLNAIGQSWKQLFGVPLLNA